MLDYNFPTNPQLDFIFSFYVFLQLLNKQQRKWGSHKCYWKILVICSQLWRVKTKV